MRLRLIGVAPLIGAAAAAISGRVLYERIIVPLLPTVRHVPLWWWGLAASPLWLSAAYLGWQSSSIREAVVVSLGMTLGSHAYLYWASITNRPGLVNQPLAEVDPWSFWTVTLSMYWLLLAVPIAAGYVAKRVFTKRPANTSMQPTAFGRG